MSFSASGGICGNGSRRARVSSGGIWTTPAQSGGGGIRTNKRVTLPMPAPGDPRHRSAASERGVSGTVAPA